MNQNINGTKSQSNFYGHNNQIQSIPSSSLKYSSTQNGYYTNGANVPGSKFQNFTGQNYASNQSYGQPSPYNSNYMNNNYTSSSIPNGYQINSNQNYTSYQNSNFKENKVFY